MNTMDPLNIEKTDLPEVQRDLEAFVRNIDRAVEMLRDQSVEVRGYDQRALKHFVGLDKSVRTKAIENAASMFEIYFEAVANGVRLRDDRELLRFAFRKLKMAPADDVFSLLQDGDIIEIYRNDWVQLFRNFRFFELCNYTVADILINEWFALYDRHKSITELIFKEAAEVMQGWQETREPSIPTHTMIEKFAEPRGIFEIKFKYYSPLFAGANSRAGLLAFQSAMPLSKDPQSSQKVDFIKTWN